MRKDWFAIFKVKGTVSAYKIKMWLFIISTELLKQTKLVPGFCNLPSTAQGEPDQVQRRKKKASMH